MGYDFMGRISLSLLFLTVSVLLCSYSVGNAQYTSNFIFGGGGNYSVMENFSDQSSVGQLAAVNVSNGIYEEQEGLYYVVQSFGHSMFYVVVVVIVLLGSGAFFVFFYKEVGEAYWYIRLMLFYGAYFVVLLMLNVLQPQFVGSVGLIVSTVYYVMIILLLVITSILFVVLLQGLFSKINKVK